MRTAFLFLKLSPLFLFVCVLIAVCGLALRVNLGLNLFAYLSAMLLTHLIAFYFLLKVSVGQLPDQRYLPVYIGASIATVALMLVLVGDWARNLPAWMVGILGFVVMGFCSALGATLRWFLLKVYHRFPGECEITLLHCSALLVCGVWALASFLADNTSLGQIVKATLGLYWFGLALSGFVVTAGAVRFRAFAMQLNLFLPALLGIACFGWLAYRLGSLQMEPLRELAVSHVQP